VWIKDQERSYPTPVIFPRTAFSLYLSFPAVSIYPGFLMNSRWGRKLKIERKPRSLLNFFRFLNGLTAPRKPLAGGEGSRLEYPQRIMQNDATKKKSS
jgi:hypothetical protein